MEVSPFVGNTNMASVEQPASRVLVAARVHLARDRTAQAANTFQLGGEELRRQIGDAPMIFEKCFQTKVKASDVTHLDLLWHKHGLDHAEAYLQPAARIALNRNCLYLPFHWTMLTELVATLANLNAASGTCVGAIRLQDILVVFQQFPASLLEQKRLEAFDLSELWQAALLLEKALVSIVQSFANLLNGLRTEYFPVGETLTTPPELGELCFEGFVGDMLTREFVVAFVECQRMVPDHACHIDLVVQQARSFSTIQAVFVGFMNVDGTRHHALNEILYTTRRHTNIAA
jgi:hypothetical protein